MRVTPADPPCHPHGKPKVAETGDQSACQMFFARIVSRRPDGDYNFIEPLNWNDEGDVWCEKESSRARTGVARNAGFSIEHISLPLAVLIMSDDCDSSWKFGSPDALTCGVETARRAMAD